MKCRIVPVDADDATAVAAIFTWNVEAVQMNVVTDHSFAELEIQYKYECSAVQTEGAFEDSMLSEVVTYTQ